MPFCMFYVLLFFYSQIANGEGVSRIYSVTKNTPRYGKGSGFLQYNPETNKVYYVVETYNINIEACEFLTVPEASLVIRREFRPECLRFDSYVSTKAFTNTRFISQDPSKYFWWFICLEGGSVRSFEACDKRLFYLYIRQNFGTELDLTGLPWDKISKDLEDFTGKKIKEAEYTWLGKDCPFL